MAGKPKAIDTPRRNRMIGIRVTPAEYTWLVNEAAALTRKHGYRVTMSGVATKLLAEAMKRA